MGFLHPEPYCCTLLIVKVDTPYQNVARSECEFAKTMSLLMYIMINALSVQR